MYIETKIKVLALKKGFWKIVEFFFLFDKFGVACLFIQLLQLT